jgi:hypothetical protein
MTLVGFPSVTMYIISNKLYIAVVFFWDILRRMKLSCQRFGTLCTHLPMKMELPKHSMPTLATSRARHFVGLHNFCYEPFEPLDMLVSLP